MEKPLLEKYVDDKLVQITSLADIRQFAICDNIIKGYGKDGYDVELEFDTYENACEGMKIIRSKIAQEQKWDKEFEDGIALCFSWEYHGIELRKRDLEKLFKKYLNMPLCDDDENKFQKVKIKVRKGCIQIERI